MRAEFLKIRSMPTPMWCLISVVICFVLGFAGVVHWGLGDDADAADIAIGIPTLIVSIIFGVWVMGVEFGQNTLRQALTADPRRGRLVAYKIAVIVICVSFLTAAFYLLSLPLYNLAGGGSVDAEILIRAGLSALVNNVTYALVGFAFALITSSMAGGITMALVFVFVIDSVTSLVSWTEDLAMGPALSSISAEITGTNSDPFGDTVEKMNTQDVIVVAAWLVVLIGLGTLRFYRSEVK